MLLDNTDAKIIGAFSHNYFDLLSINQIAGRVGKRYPYVYKRVNALIGSGLLRMVVLGRSHLCSLNLDSPMVRLVLGYHHLHKQDAYMKQESVRSIQDMLYALRSPPYFCVADCLSPVVRHVYVAHPSKRSSQAAAGLQIHFESLEAIYRRLQERAKGLFYHHLILYGSEYFLEYLRRHQEELKMRHNPLISQVRS